VARGAVAAGCRPLEDAHFLSSVLLCVLGLGSWALGRHGGAQRLSEWRMTAFCIVHYRFHVSRFTAKSVRGFPVSYFLFSISHCGAWCTGGSPMPMRGSVRSALRARGAQDGAYGLQPDGRILPPPPPTLGPLPRLGNQGNLGSLCNHPPPNKLLLDSLRDRLGHSSVWH
jgi:hypothetical protein